MIFKVGDRVTRNSYQNDIVFEIVKVEGNQCILKGINVRLEADSKIDDLQKYNGEPLYDDESFYREIAGIGPDEREDYFYLPGKILHIDGDENYLNRCLKFYKKANIMAYGIYEEEEKIGDNVIKFLTEIKPDVIVITGHDAYYRKIDMNDPNAYKNTNHFIRAISKAREYEKAHDKLVIIAGACQSNYEQLIKAGANFASSPKRINIHALDPAIIALQIAMCDRSQDIDLIGILSKTKYGKDGMGGVITKGMMYKGYPRQ